MRWFGLVLAGAVLVGCAPRIDKAHAGKIASDYFAGAHGSGITLSDVHETDFPITGDPPCPGLWEVKMDATVTESSGISHGSTMYLCVDPATGEVTVGESG